MNQENFEFRNLVEVRDWEEHDIKSRRTLILDIVLIVLFLYVLFFVGHYIKWPFIALLALVYFARRLL